VSHVVKASFIKNGVLSVDVPDLLFHFT